MCLGLLLVFPTAQASISGRPLGGGKMVFITVFIIQQLPLIPKRTHEKHVQPQHGETMAINNNVLGLASQLVPTFTSHQLHFRDKCHIITENQITTMKTVLILVIHYNMFKVLETSRF